MIKEHHVKVTTTETRLFKITNLSVEDAVETAIELASQTEPDSVESKGEVVETIVSGIPELESDDFVKYAERIWRSGETQEGRTGRFCLLPSEYEGGDDFVINKYGITHYDLYWHDRGKSVKVAVYASDEFGASLFMEKTGEVIVYLGEQFDNVKSIRYYYCLINNMRVLNETH